MTFRVEGGERTERDSDLNQNINERIEFQANQAKVRDSGKSISTAAHHFSVSSSDRRKL